LTTPSANNLVTLVHFFLFGMLYNILLQNVAAAAEGNFKKAVKMFLMQNIFT